MNRRRRGTLLNAESGRGVDLAWSGNFAYNPISVAELEVTQPQPMGTIIAG